MDGGRRLRLGRRQATRACGVTRPSLASPFTCSCLWRLLCFACFTAFSLSSHAGDVGRVTVFSIRATQPSRPGMTDQPPKDNAIQAMQCKRKCPDCDYTPPSRARWIEHRRVHSGERPFTCPSCDATFKTQSGCDAHVKQVHLKVDRVTCSWSGCDMSFSQASNMRKHVAIIHLKKRFPCSVAGCNFQSASPYDLSNHKRAMHEGRQVACSHEGCDYRTSWPSYMKSHVQEVHEKIKRFACHVCDKSFYQKVALQAHQQVHARQGHPVADCASCQEELRKLSKRSSVASQEEQPSVSSDGVNHLLTAFHVDLQLLSSCE